jgi:hypothetical protein
MSYRIYYNGEIIKDTFYNNVLWSGHFSHAESNGSILNCIQEYLLDKDIFFVIFQSDGNIQSDLIYCVFSENGFDYNDVKHKTLVGTLSQKSEDMNLNYLYIPLDDYLFSNGIFFNNLPSWEERFPIAYWRGGSSGWGGLEIVRCRVVRELLNHKHSDVKLIKRGWEIGKNIPENYFSESVDYTKFLNYKIFLIIDGNCIASNHMWGFGSGCVPFIISNATCWFQKYLIPDVNCIIINYDLSNLIEKIEWVLNNDSKAKGIAENALKFSVKYFNSSFQKKYLEEEIDSFIEKIKLVESNISNTEEDYTEITLNEVSNEKSPVDLHLWTIKSPRTRRLISHKGNGYQAIEIARGVKSTNNNSKQSLQIVNRRIVVINAVVFVKII